MKNRKIKIMKNGPYVVSGSVPLEEKVIRFEGHGNHYEEGQAFPQAGEYALCRCGYSKNIPFCDASHCKIPFDGTETASKEPYLNQAELMEGSDFMLTDSEELCAFARFCHKELGDVWNLTNKSDNPEYRKEAVRAACDCPAGRLVVWVKKTGGVIEPAYGSFDCDTSGSGQAMQRTCLGPGRYPH